MASFETTTITAAWQSECQDRVAVFEDEIRAVIVVADGAGGIGSGAAAAQGVIEEVRAYWRQTLTASTWERVLSEIDQRLFAGESTAVVVDLSTAGICGASVGDTQAWIIKDGEISNLTAGQRRKPLLGSREATPVGFESQSLDGLLLVATDGFCNYVNRPRMLPVLAKAWFPVLPKQLLELVRLPSGELWDDVGIVACRRRPPQAPRVKHYVID